MNVNGNVALDTGSRRRPDLASAAELVRAGAAAAAPAQAANQ
jgi:hypothetical protein